MQVFPAKIAHILFWNPWEDSTLWIVPASLPHAIISSTPIAMQPRQRSTPSQSNGSSI